VSAPGYGIAFPADGVPLADHVGWLRAVEDAGYTHLWAGEAMAADAFAMLAMASVVAPSLHLGTAVVPAFTRAPGLLAVSAATLAALAPGRCTVGIGASSVAVVERWGGVPYTSPYERTRDVLRFLRPALAGARVSERFATFAVDGFRLANPPAVPPDLLVAALRPRMLGLAAELADGAVLTWVSPADVERMAVHVRALDPAHRIVVWVTVCPSTDGAAVRDRMRPVVAEYLNVAGYAGSQRWLGRADTLTPIWEAWTAGRRRDAVAAVPDSLVDEFVVHGSVPACRERLAEYCAAGASELVVSVLPLDADPTECARRLAPL
jgi:probable F420-dependent oxidoreductase